ncbi:MAG: helix-turn-helix transcriptional regulator [Bacteroidales bacterium]|nr:helix-turn-helix transcriptional regulator [Bacteroidales bacterium]
MKQHVNDFQIRDYDAVLDAEFGAPGTPERAIAEERAYAFYSGQILRDARKEEKITQAELASRIGSTKSYISKIEHGTMTPSVSTFYRIVGALGLQVILAKRAQCAAAGIEQV